MAKKDNALSHVTVDFIGNPNAVRVEHTNDGVRVIGNYQGGLKDVKVVDTPLDPEVAEVEKERREGDYVFAKSESTGETATPANAEATAADPDVEAARRELRDAKAKED